MKPTTRKFIRPTRLQWWKFRQRMANTIFKTALVTFFMSLLAYLTNMPVLALTLFTAGKYMIAVVAAIIISQSFELNDEISNE